MAKAARQTVPLSTQISPEIAKDLRAFAARHRLSIRVILEEALKVYFRSPFLPGKSPETSMEGKPNKLKSATPKKRK